MDTKRASISLSKIAMFQNGRQWLAMYIGHVTLSKMAGNCPALASARVIEKIFAFMGHLLEAWLTQCGRCCGVFLIFAFLYLGHLRHNPLMKVRPVLNCILITSNIVVTRCCIALNVSCIDFQQGLPFQCSWLTS